MRLASEGKVVLKGESILWEQNRQGLIRFYLHPQNWEQVAAPGWVVHRQRIRTHSGKHTHQGGTVIFVLEGRGYTIVDGTRFDWEEGDLIILPIKPNGCEHQHFNTDPNKPSEWLALSHDCYYMAIGKTLEQKENHPDWKGAATPPSHTT